MRKSSRPLALIGSLAVHLALVALGLSAKPAPPTEAALGPMFVSLYDGVAPRPSMDLLRPRLRAVETVASLPQVRVDPMTVPTDLVVFVSRDLPEAPSVDEPVTDATDLASAPAATASPRALAAGETCQLTQWIQAELSADPTVAGALASIPRAARSVANAIMLWDGAWIETRAVSPSQIEPIRHAVILGVRNAPPACLDEEMRGPLLMSVNDRHGATLLAVGSGVWKWSDLLPAPGDGGIHN